MKRLTAAVLGCLLFLGACARGGKAPELLEPVAVSSDLVRVEYGTVYNGMVFEGSVVPETEELSFSANGTVEEICAVLGDRVKKGDPLIRLDTVALQEHRDDLAEQLENARIMDDFATREAELRETRLLWDHGSYSARYRLYKNEQDQAALSRSLEIAALEEKLEKAEEDLNVRSVLRAPFDGTVAAINVQVGDAVWPKAVAAVVANDSACYLRTEFINGTNLSMAKAMHATVSGVRYEVTYLPMETSDYLAKALAGETLYSAFRLEKGNSSLLGQYGLLYLMTDQRDQVLNIPINALLWDAESNYVYVDQNGERVRRNVEIGLKTEAQVEILSGLQEGESVYVVG